MRVAKNTVAESTSCEHVGVLGPGCCVRMHELATVFAAHISSHRFLAWTVPNRNLLYENAIGEITVHEMDIVHPETCSFQFLGMHPARPDVVTIPFIVQCLRGNNGNDVSYGGNVTIILSDSKRGLTVR